VYARKQEQSGAGVPQVVKPERLRQACTLQCALVIPPGNVVLVKRFSVQASKDEIVFVRLLFDLMPLKQLD
jgi:hypothetical protein